MTGSRLVIIIVIFIGVTIAWIVLGASIYTRTQTAKADLRGDVESMWGTPLSQSTPRLTLRHAPGEEAKQGETASEPRATVPDSSEIEVDLGLDLRRRGLIWFRTYEVTFDAEYTVQNPHDTPQELAVTLLLPTPHAIYDDFVFEVNGRRASPVSEGGQVNPQATQTTVLHSGESGTIHAHYRSRGIDSWRYTLGQDVIEAKDFRMTVRTDFDRIDFPADSHSPTEKRQLNGGWELVWRFDHVISGLSMGVEMPVRLNPGPWAARLSYFAPVGLLFYFLVLVIVGMLHDRNLHPMHYLLISGAFFAFHLLLAYTVDHVTTHLAFTIAAIVSVLLVVSYLIRVIGARFTLLVAAPAQLAFLVLFSYAFYFPGYTGLTITIGSIVTLAVLMHVTAGVDWAQKFGDETREESDKPSSEAPGAPPPPPHDDVES